MAWTGLADVARIRGEFSTAADWLNQAAEEWARVLDLPSIDDDFFIHYRGGRLDADRGDYEAAAKRFAVAIERLRVVEEAPVHRVPVLIADRARAQCESGSIEPGLQSMDELADTSHEQVRRARNEALAVCALAGGVPGSGPGADSTLDPAWIPAEHIELAEVHSGDVSEIARLELLRARLSIAAGRPDEAEPLLASANARLDASGVRSDHPLRARLKAADGS